MTVLFWTVAAGVGLGAAGTLAWPLVRPRRVDADVPTRAAYDLAVYRDQLSEIERDLASGLLPPDQAEAARLEVQRRLLAVPVAPVGPTAEGEIPAPEIPPPQVITVPAGNRSRAAAAALVIGLPAAALALYTVVGMPGQRDLPFAQRLDEAGRAITSTEAPASPTTPDAPESGDRMASLKAAIAANPEDPEPRLQLARLLLQAGQAAEAVAQTTEAARLAPGSALVLAEHGQILVMAGGGRITEQAHGVFLSVLALDATEPRARFFLGLERLQMGDAKGALAIWRHLKADTPADAPWAAMLDEQVSVVARNAGVDVETIAPQSALAFPAESWTPAKDAPAAMPPPTMGGSEAGGLGSLRTDIGETERASIEAMVGGLKKKLETSPDDFDTWMMLARSQRVLQKHADAVDSYGKALGLRPGDMEARRGMAFALIAESQAKGESEPPEALYMVMASILRDSPEDQEALFFVGLQAANKGDGAKARELWSRLLLQLPKESSLAGQIRARMEALPK